MNKFLKRQVYSVYGYSFFTGLLFWYGIEQLFLNQIGDGVFIRGVTLAVFSVAMLLTNIPIGAFSDIYGRVLSLKIGLIILLLALVILGSATGTVVYAIGAFIFGIFWSFDDGAKESFIYDTLKDQNKTDLYQKILGRMYALMLVGAAVANFLSGIIAQLTSLRFTYWLSLLSALAAFWFVAKLSEPDHHKQTGVKIIHQFGKAITELKLSRILLILVVAQALIYTVGTIVDDFAQVSLAEVIFNPIYFGWLWAVFGLILAAGNLFAHKISRPFVFIFLLLALLFGYLLFGAYVIGLLLLLLFGGGQEVLGIKGQNAIQHNTKSHLRATMSSIPGSASMLMVAIISPFLGQVDGSIVAPLFGVGFVLTLAVLLLWLKAKSHIISKN